MTDPLFAVGAFVLIGGLAILYGYKRTMTNAAIAAADAASLAAYQRRLDPRPSLPWRATQDDLRRGAGRLRS